MPLTVGLFHVRVSVGGQKREEEQFFTIKTICLLEQNKIHILHHRYLISSTTTDSYRSDREMIEEVAP